MTWNPIIDSIGIEIEARNISRRFLRHVLRRPDCRVIQDGSVRNYRPALFTLPINLVGEIDRNHPLRSLISGETELGAEVVSSIIDSSQPGWDDYIMEVLELLASFGEGIMPQSGVHIHVNARGVGINVLHNIVNLWKALEAGIYRLSCAELGYHRGERHMDYHYFRPLTKRGPLVVAGNRPCYDLDILLNTKSVNEFFMAYGRIDIHNQHYHSPRYAALCFHSLVRHGTVELRTPNSTLTPAYIKAWVELAKAIVRKAFDKFLPELPSNPLGTNKLSLEFLVDLLEFRNPQLIYTLEELWNRGHFPPAVRGWRYTHLSNQRDRFDWGNVPSKLVPNRLPDTTTIYDSNSFAAEESELEPGFIEVPALEKAIEYEIRGRI